MNKSSIFRLAVVAVALSASSAFAGPGDGTMAVTAKVDGVCKFVSAGTMAFGTLNQLSAADAPGSSSVVYRCTRGVTPQFSVGGDKTGSYTTAADKRLKGTANGEFIPFTVTWNPATVTAGTGLGNDVTVALTGSIANADFINVSADNYNATVDIVVTP
jgi:spore coat protein U-like protein